VRRLPLRRLRPIKRPFLSIFFERKIYYFYKGYKMNSLDQLSNLCAETVFSLAQSKTDSVLSAETVTANAYKKSLDLVFTLREAVEAGKLSNHFELAQAEKKLDTDNKIATRGWHMPEYHMKCVFVCRFFNSAEEHWVLVYTLSFLDVKCIFHCSVSATEVFNYYIELSQRGETAADEIFDEYLANTPVAKRLFDAE
jgi:hypothetical protein